MLAVLVEVQEDRSFGVDKSLVAGLLLLESECVLVLQTKSRLGRSLSDYQGFKAIDSITIKPGFRLLKLL